ncbi:MAG: hypothetical protein JNL81_03310 [Hyphomonadaceae bacterium]|nr:hypothetical protein [Hyphomonadaceae bacterium]
MIDDVSASSRGDTKRGFWWWLSAWLTPIGIAGGPVALADLFAGVVRWNGWIAYLINFWDEHISSVFGLLFDYVAGLLRFPPLAEWQTDYLTLGILFAGAYGRSITLNRSPDPGLRNPFLMSFLLAVLIFVWPLSMVAFSWQLVELMRGAEPDANDVATFGEGKIIPTLGLVLAPFITFVVLFFLNFVA